MNVGEVSEKSKGDIVSESSGKCPVAHGAITEVGARKNWWPNALNLDILHQHDTKIDPLGNDFDYHEELKKLEPLFCLTSSKGVSNELNR